MQDDLRDIADGFLTNKPTAFATASKRAKFAPVSYTLGDNSMIKNGATLKARNPSIRNVRSASIRELTGVGPLIKVKQELVVIAEASRPKEPTAKISKRRTRSDQRY